MIRVFGRVSLSLLGVNRTMHRWSLRQSWRFSLRTDWNPWLVRPNHKALAKVFKGKLLDAIKAAGLTLPAALPETWVVDCRCVGDG